MIATDRMRNTTTNRGTISPQFPCRSLASAQQHALVVGPLSLASWKQEKTMQRQDLYAARRSVKVGLVRERAGYTYQLIESDGEWLMKQRADLFFP